MKRRKLSYKKSKRSFHKAARKVNRRNAPYMSMRGGIRL